MDIITDFPRKIKRFMKFFSFFIKKENLQIFI